MQKSSNKLFLISGIVTVIGAVITSILPLISIIHQISNTVSGTYVFDRVIWDIIFRSFFVVLQLIIGIIGSLAVWFNIKPTDSKLKTLVNVLSVIFAVLYVISAVLFCIVIFLTFVVFASYNGG